MTTKLKIMTEKEFLQEVEDIINSDIFIFVTDKKIYIEKMKKLYAKLFPECKAEIKPVEKRLYK